MDEQGNKDAPSDYSGTVSPGARPSMGIEDRGRKVEEVDDVQQLNPQPEVPSRGSDYIRLEKEKIGSLGSGGTSINTSNTAGAYSVSSDQARRKEERHRQTNSIQSRTSQGDDPVEQDRLDENYQVEATAVVKDDEADERVRRLEEQMAAMMQGAAPAVAVDKSNDSEESEAEFAGQSFCQRYRCFILIAVALIAIGGGVAGYLLGSQASSPATIPDSSSSGSSPKSVPTQAPISGRTQSSPFLDATERRTLLETLLTDMVPTIQPTALDWLSDVDAWEPENGTSTESQQWIERYVMVVFYYAANGGNWAAGWLETTKSVCDDWRGIDVCNPNGLIVDLKLGTFGLTGTIPSEIGLLTELTSLRAGDNTGFGGQIPTEIGNLSNLKHLSISKASLNGSIPTEVSIMTSLTYISLWDNINLGGTIPTLPSSITTFYAYQCNLVGTLPSMQQLTNLIEFEVEQNSLTGSLPDLSQLTKLESFTVETNFISGSIPPSIGNMTALSLFIVFDNSLTGSIPTEIGLLKRLAELHIDYNRQLSGNIPTEIGLLTRLWDLQLYNTNLGGSIPSEIGMATALENLSLYECPFLEGTLPTEIGNLVNLKDLVLFSTRIEGAIPSEIGLLASLTNLDFDGCRLTGEIPAEIINCRFLNNLQLDSNQLTGIVPPLPSSLTGCQLFSNCFSDLGNAPQVCIVYNNCA